MIPQNTLSPAGPGAGEIATLSWIVYIIFAVVTAGMWILIAWLGFRRKGTLNEHAPVELNDGHEWILTGGFAIPFVILTTIFILGLRSMSAFPIHDHGMPQPQIIITAHQWWWEVEYVGALPNLHFKTANEIHIPAGQPVDIELASADVIHSFWVPKLNGKVDLIPGQPNIVRMKADQPGSYRGQCAEYCGAQHAHMNLHVIAQRPEEYAAWVQTQLTDAPEPVNDQQKAGRDLFMSEACVLCHTIHGTDAHGILGPDLTHVGSRQGIAADMLANNEANLRAWVTHAQSLKPGSLMPNLTQFTGEQLGQLTAYLKSLH